MNAKLAHLLTGLYPRAWKERYREEFETLLQAERGGVGAAFNVVWSALLERLSPTPGLDFHPQPGSVLALTRKPSAFLPMAMSLTALAIVLAHIAFFGAAHEPDEGATAHLWQLLMAGQIPVLVFFAVKWLPRATERALIVLALQAGAVMAAMAPVFLLHL